MKPVEERSGAKKISSFQIIEDCVGHIIEPGFSSPSDSENGRHISISG